MQYEPPAINFPVGKESPQERLEGGAVWPWPRIALARERRGSWRQPGARLAGARDRRQVTPLGQTHIKQGNRRQGRRQEPRY